VTGSGPALVVLAAGASTRLGRPKALVQLPGPDGAPARTALERLLAAGAALGDDSPLVVVGAHAPELSALLSACPGVEVLEHADWAAGRTGSLQAAIGRRPGRDLCVAPVDVPAVPREVFTALAAEWVRLGRPPRGWLAPRHGGRFGHPVLLGRDLAGALNSFPADRPLRELRTQAHPLAALAVSAPEVLDDLDTPADLARMRRDRGRA
jgi:molybdenum cofactor cytidylyltransferase